MCRGCGSHMYNNTYQVADMAMRSSPEGRYVMLQHVGLVADILRLTKREAWW